MCRTRHGGVLARCCVVGLTAGALLVAPLNGSCEEREPVPLGVVLKAIAANSRSADVAGIERARADAVQREVQASYQPTVELKGGYTLRDSPMVAVFDSFVAPFGTGTYWQYELAAKQLVWDGGRRRAAVEAAKKTVDAADAGGHAAVVETQLEGLEIYLGAVEAHLQLHVLAQRIAALKVHLEDAQNLYEQGMAARNDLLETQVRLRSVQDQIPALQDVLVVAGRKIARLMDWPAEQIVTVPEQMPEPPLLPAQDEELVAKSPKGNARVTALTAQLEAARRKEEARGKDRLPEVLLEASHTYQENPYLLYQHANIAMLGVRWDVFDGGARKARTTEARLAAERIERDLQEAQRQAAEGVDAALRAYHQALRQVKTAKDNVAASKENLRIVSDQYRAGLARGSDVLDAEALLAGARSELAQRRLDVYQGQARALALAGLDLAKVYEVAKSSGEDTNER